MAKEWTEEERAEARRAAKAYWTPARKEAARARTAAYWTPERRAEAAAKAAKRWSPGKREAARAQWTPERRAQQSRMMKRVAERVWTPERRAAAAAAVSPEQREKLREAGRRHYAQRFPEGAAWWAWWWENTPLDVPGCPRCQTPMHPVVDWKPDPKPLPGDLSRIIGWRCYPCTKETYGR